MTTATIAPKYQVVIPREIREKLRLTPRQRLQILEKGGVITLVPQVPLTRLRDIVKKGMKATGIREKQPRGHAGK